jgi:hypothetical protein
MICACGDPTALGVVHLRTRPCFHYVEREWVGLATEEARKFYESDLSRVELINKIDEFLQEKNND